MITTKTFSPNHVVCQSREHYNAAVDHEYGDAEFQPDERWPVFTWQNSTPGLC